MPIGDIIFEMVRNNKRASYVARRKNKKRNNPKKRRMQLARMNVGPPQSIIRKLRYQYNGTLTPAAAGAADVQVFRLNSLYDPDFTGAGNQPRYFDQYMALYDKYLVLGARIKVTAFNTSTSEQHRFGICVKTNSSQNGTGQGYIENEKLQRNALFDIEGSGKSVRTMTLNWSAKKWFSKPNVTTEYDLTGGDSSNPTTLAYLHVYADNPWSATGGAIRYQIDIDFITQFKEPLHVTQS